MNCVRKITDLFLEVGGKNMFPNPTRVSMESVKIPVKQKS